MMHRAHTMLADGRTVAEWAGPQLNQLYGSNRMPPLLPGISTDD